MVKFFGRLGKMDCFFISTPLVLAAYILSNHGIFCLFFEHITMRSLPPINTPKLPGGGTVGAPYSRKGNPYPLRESHHHQAQTKPQTIRTLGN
jgi:hypothetical protein